MTAPTPSIATIEPSKAKTWVAAVGGVLTIVVPSIVSVSTYLPDPWPAVIGGFIGLLTVVGVYKAPYKPEGTSVVANTDLKEVANPLPPQPAPEVLAPWKKPGF